MVASRSTSIVAPVSAVERPPVRYADDVVFPAAWHGVAVRSTEPHARLLGIERDPAFDWSRAVRRAVTHIVKDEQQP